MTMAARAAEEALLFQPVGNRFERCGQKQKQKHWLTTHHLVSQDAVQVLVMHNAKPVQSNELVGLQFKSAITHTHTEPVHYTCKEGFSLNLTTHTHAYTHPLTNYIHTHTRRHKHLQTTHTRALTSYTHTRALTNYTHAHEHLQTDRLLCTCKHTEFLMNIHSFTYTFWV